MRYIYLIPLLILILCPSCDKSDTTIKPNAEILSFNPEKCYCCWGWTIKIGNDTIKSDNIIIGETIGSEIEYPVDVYIQIGEIENKCSDLGLTHLDFYKVIKIEKTK